MRVNPEIVGLTKNSVEKPKSKGCNGLAADVFDAAMAQASRQGHQDAGREFTRARKVRPASVANETGVSADAGAAARIEALIQFAPQGLTQNGSMVGVPNDQEVTQRVQPPISDRGDPPDVKITSPLAAGWASVERNDKESTDIQEDTGSSVGRRTPHLVGASRGATDPTAPSSDSERGDGRTDARNGQPPRPPPPASRPTAAGTSDLAQPAGDGGGRALSDLGKIASNEADETLSLHSLRGDLADQVEQTVRTALVSVRTDRLDNVRLVLRTEVAGDVEVRIAVEEGRATIEIAATQDKAKSIEHERAALEARLQQATGVNVDVSVISRQPNLSDHRQETMHHEFEGGFYASAEKQSDGERRSGDREQRDPPAPEVGRKAAYTGDALPAGAPSRARRDLLM